jgi:hypothetical protein
VSENTCAKLLGSINNYPNQKMIAWYPHNQSPYTIALHEADTSQIRILRLFDQDERANSNIGLEINTRHWVPFNFNRFRSTFKYWII